MRRGNKIKSFENQGLRLLYETFPEHKTQNQKAVPSYFVSEQLLYFVFAVHCTTRSIAQCIGGNSYIHVLI